jgi:predicted ArsR family transcriptional regulator
MSIDICQNNHGGNENSVAAHNATNKEGAFLKIVEFLWSNGPALCEEIVNAIPMVHQTVSARISELKALGLVVAVDQRKTSRGRNASVWAIHVRSIFSPDELKNRLFESMKQRGNN